MTDSAAVTQADAGKEVPVRRLAIASTIGTIIEAYDFVLYGTVGARRGRLTFAIDIPPGMSPPSNERVTHLGRSGS